jgi:hypothetical protein
MEWMISVSWGAAMMYVDLSRSAIRNAPSYDPHRATTPQYERSVIDYYGHPKHRDVDIRWMEHPS